MRSINLSSIVLLIIITFLNFSVRCQSTAMDFTQDDCEGPSHHLYSELDGGKVIILDFIMLNCAPCIVGTNALTEIIASYAESHPGRVQLYSFGFLNSYTCEQILAWKSNNQYIHPVFNNGEEQVNYYGGMGMPTIAVVGTNEHKVFFKSIGYTSALDGKIRAAIDTALLYNPTGVADIPGSIGFRAYPTVFSDHIFVEANPGSPGSEIFIYDTFGRMIRQAELSPGRMTLIPTESYSPGMYIVRMSAADASSGFIKLIKN